MSLGFDIESRKELFGGEVHPELHGLVNGREFKPMYVEGPSAALSLPMISTVFRDFLARPSIHDIFDGLGARVGRMPDKKGCFIVLQTLDIQSDSDRTVLHQTIGQLMRANPYIEGDGRQWWLPDPLTALSFKPANNDAFELHLGTLK